MPPLTTHDARILQNLFDTEPTTTTTTDGDNTITIDPTLPPYPTPASSSSSPHQPNPVLISQINNPKLLQTLHHREINIINQLRPTTSSTEMIKTAIAGFDALIGDYPWLASAYVNRAQGLRLLVDVGAGAGAGADAGADAGKGTSLNQSYGLLDPSNSTLVSRIFDDLGRAIVLSTPASAGEGGGNGNENGDGTCVSPTQARILADAHTHRGYLLLRAARLKEANAKKAKNLKAKCTCTTKSGSEIWPKPGSGSVFESESKPGELGNENQHTGSRNVQEEGCCCRVLDKEPQRLEELASRDFFLGGRYGNRVAGELAVRTNPYAKMCGEIVRGAMGREMG